MYICTHPECGDGSLGSCQVQRPVSDAVCGVHGGTAVEEEADGGAMVAPRGAVQRGARNVVLVLEVGPGVQKELDHLPGKKKKSWHTRQQYFHC